MAWRMPFPPSRMPASIEFSIKRFVCLIQFPIFMIFISTCEGTVLQERDARDDLFQPPRRG
jgi:hypothetical protein